MKDLISLGIFKTTDGKKFDCVFIPSKNLAKAIKMPQDTGFGAETIDTKAASTQEAKEKLVLVLGPGKF